MKVFRLSKLGSALLKYLRLWFDYRLEHDPAFQRRIDKARQSIKDGRGVRLCDIDDQAP